MRRVAGQGCSRSATLHVLPTHTPSLTPARAMSIKGWFNKLPFSDPPSRTMTSQDIYVSPRAGQGYNPILALDYLQRITGPLRRRHSTKPEDYLNVDETRQWMEVKQAAKVLQLTEAELPLLTREKLEKKWHALYAVRTNAAQEEVLIATEVLLEYLDSAMYVKHNRQYYRDVVQNARIAIDAELQAQRRGVRQVMLYAFVVLLSLGSVLVMVMAVLKRYTTVDDVNLVRQRVADYMTMTFMQHKNVEPAPDYSTRYFVTPTAMTLDEQTGRDGLQFVQSHTAELLRQKDVYEQEEAAEMLRLMNEENEKASRARAAEDVQRSRVAVIQTPPSTSSDTEKKLEEQAVLNATTYRSFVSMLAHNYGIASRFQRLTDAATEQAAQKREIERRLQEEEAAATAKRP